MRQLFQWIYFDWNIIKINDFEGAGAVKKKEEKKNNKHTPIHTIDYDGNHSAKCHWNVISRTWSFINFSVDFKSILCHHFDADVFRTDLNISVNQIVESFLFSQTTKHICSFTILKIRFAHFVHPSQTIRRTIFEHSFRLSWKWTETPWNCRCQMIIIKV